jgi:hypothetical protein
MPPPLEECAKEPVKYIGTETTDKRFHHGGLRQAVGVHRYQAFRVNRTSPSEEGPVGYTYNHQPYLAYWNGKFYLQYLSCEKEEHHPPGRTHLVVSQDGRNWEAPQVVFPVYPLPEIKGEDFHIPEGMPAVMHQRMGFYVAPNGRLLTLGFYGFCATPRHSPNDGDGLGRVVREIYEDGSFERIYFIRYNGHAGWNETNTRYPFYKESPDRGFVEACESLLADKLMTLQWWEEDQSKDGFYTIDAFDDEIKALSFFHRPDNVVVALWKRQWSALSADEGKTWTTQVESPTLMTCGGKVWGQRTEDGRYAIVYDHSATRRNRFPLAVMTGDDGHIFDNLLCLHGEVAPMRYQGIHKALGPQYIRGIAEGNGDPPGKHMWNTYSMNKEDIWVSRARRPIGGTVEEDVNEDFQSATTESDLELWNLYIPKWAPIMIVSDPEDEANHCLLLKDEEPYDYAFAERIFPESPKVQIDFRVRLEQIGHGAFEFEVHDKSGQRPLRVRMDPEWLSMDLGGASVDPLPSAIGKWMDIGLQVDCDSQSYKISVDGDWKEESVSFNENVESVERLVFRTGSWRSDVRSWILEGEPANRGLYMEDLPGADDPISANLVFLDDVEARSLTRREK